MAHFCEVLSVGVHVDFSVFDFFAFVMVQGRVAPRRVRQVGLLILSQKRMLVAST